MSYEHEFPVCACGAEATEWFRGDPEWDTPRAPICADCRDEQTSEEEG